MFYRAFLPISWAAGLSLDLDQPAGVRPRTLDPGQAFHASVRGIIYGGVEAVSHLGPDGSVVASDSGPS